VAFSPAEEVALAQRAAALARAAGPHPGQPRGGAAFQPVLSGGLGM